MASGPFLNSGAWMTAVTAVDTTAKEELGVLRFENGRVYKYVKAVDAAITAGFAAEYSGTTGTNVRLAVASAHMYAGVAETTLTSGSFGWLTVQGLTSAMCNSSV